MRQFLLCLLNAAEKAAEIARVCRKEKELFKLLIQEKSGPDKNSKFAHDFKTLGDVLIQETVRHDLGKQFPDLAANIRGEESCKFTNTLGETIQVRVCGTERETSDLLAQVLDSDKHVAGLLAKQVHSETFVPESVRTDLEEKVGADWKNVNVEDLGIWIDPIDSTNNYIYGDSITEMEVAADRSMVSKGLHVVTVLIGVYDKSSGKPIIGVINQPFAEYDKEKESWRGQSYWGVCCQGHQVSSSSLGGHPSAASGGDREASQDEKVVISFREDSLLRDQLKKKYKLYPAAGAGYKMLCVAKGWVGMYVTQKGSTYKWDTCAGHAILLSLGGGALDFKSSLGTDSSDPDQLLYQEPLADQEGVNQWANKGGILAFRDRGQLEPALKLVREKDWRQTTG